ncbi:MAG TPA: M28 family peptidase [Candidatus Binatia bacterium]|nr:M28 family peptidase [Candidatus Binatia bacterium]
MDISVDREQLRRNLQMIVGERSPFSGQSHLAAVERFVAKEFENHGLIVESDFFSYQGKRFRNVIARLGAPREEAVVIIGAHIDSVVGTPGADDNASGVAVLLECARILSKAKLQSQVLLCAFNLEELNMIGSAALAKKLKAAGARVGAMVSLETVGYTNSRPGSQKLPIGLSRFYPDRGDFIGVIGNWRSDALLRKFSEAMREVPDLPVETLSVPGNGMLIPAVRLSDHSPFWDAGYPALMVTDTAFYRNPHYHAGTDSVETLDIEFMAKVGEGVIHAVTGLCEDGLDQ